MAIRFGASSSAGYVSLHRHSAICLCGRSAERDRCCHDLDPRKKATFHWIGRGVSMNESEPIAEIDTAGLNPGVYKVGGHVSEGNRAGQSADCTAAYTVISRAVVEK